MITALLLASLLPSLQPINHIPLPADKPAFRFVVLGDNRPAGEGQPPTDTFKQILREVRTIHPDFVLSSGDLLYGNEEPIEAYRTEADQVAALLKELDVPFFNAPGNHEIAEKPEFLAEYVKRFAAPYGSFDFGGYRFAAVCTELLGSKGAVRPDEMSWLDQTLDGSKPAFVFMHRPIFAREAEPGDGARATNHDELAKLFAARRVKSVFQGHDHVYNRQEHDGIEYVISGGAGAPLDAFPQEGGFFHYILYEVKDGKVTSTVLPAGSIEITASAKGASVMNYGGAALELNDVRVPLRFSPTTVKAELWDKKVRTSVQAELVKVTGSAGSYTAHVHLNAKKHRQTVLTFS